MKKRDIKTGLLTRKIQTRRFEKSNCGEKKLQKKYKTFFFFFFNITRFKNEMGKIKIWG